MPSKITYECIECGASYLKWQGQCDQCSAWNSLEPITVTKKNAKSTETVTTVTKLINVTEPDTESFKTGFVELDRVLGSGWVHGSVNLICGEPGIGKSTLVLQSLLRCNITDEPTLYITAEESTIQVKQRAKRLTKEISDQLLISSATEMETIIDIIQKERPKIVILDSIQMVISQTLSSMPGSLNQVRLCASLFIKAVKDIGAVGILVGHITKDGHLAGPKMLEHMVDVILFFEGERTMSVRMLRSLKNRYGTTNETGIFRMKGDGLQEITSSNNLISDINKEPLSGAVITFILSGTRGMLVELQSLVVQVSYEHTKRTFVGIDSHRAHLMIAILDKFFNLKLSFKDIFISLVGGLKTQLPDIDLTICFSIWSSHYVRPLPKQLVVIGEVGLTGEILPIANLDRYISSMELMGIKTCILPAGNKDEWESKRDIKPIFVENIFSAHEAFNQLCINVPIRQISKIESN